MHSLSADSRRAIDEYWANFFACPVPALRPADALVLVDAGAKAYAGIYAMSFDAHPPVALVPSRFLSTARTVARHWRAESIRDGDAIGAALAEQAGEAIGPASLAYGDAGTLKGAPEHKTVRILDADRAFDVEAVQHLQTDCSTLEWAHGGTNIGESPSVGAFAGEQLVAVAGWEVWGERIAHLSVIAHPAFRGRGFARAATAHLAARALTMGLIPQYRTLETNAASSELARSVGFVRVAASMAVRLRAEDT